MMEQFALGSGHLPLIRPIKSPAGELPPLLREGRVLNGQVLERLDGGRLLIGLGDLRVSVQSPVELEAGQRFRFEVVKRDGELLLHLVEEEGGPLRDPALLRALRALSGEQGSVGRSLRDLAARLRSAEGSSARESRPRLRALQTALVEHGHQAGQDGAALRAKISPGVFGFDAALMAALAELGVDSFAAALDRLVKEAAGRAARANAGVLPQAALGELQSAFERILHLLGSRQPEGALSPALLAELMSSFEAELRSIIEGNRASRGHPALLRWIQSGSQGGLLEGLEGEILRLLLNDTSPRKPSDLTRTLRSGAFKGMQADLKGMLLSTLLGLEAGPLAKAIGQALTSMEFEHLMNIARREAGEAAHWSFPVPDGNDWTTAHLFVQERHDARRDEFGDEQGKGERQAFRWRITLGVDFSALGPLRADLVLREDLLAMRLSIASERTYALVESSRADLEAGLAMGGRRVVLSIVHSDEEQAGVADLLRGMRFLEDNHLMDRKG